MNSDFFLSQLQRLPEDRGGYVKSDGNFWLRCINPDHAGGHENTPSAKIELAEGSSYLGRYHCFGCSTNLSWNDFATRMNLNKIDSKYEGIRHRSLNFKKITNRANNIKPLTFRWPVTKEWRGIPGQFVHDMGGYVYKSKDILADQTLIIPVMMYGEEVGVVRALTRDPKRDKRGKKIEDSYLNSSGTWIKKAFLGYDRAAKMTGPLWIVEGPRDFFRCLQAGLRVVCLLGSKFGEDRTELIRLLNPRCLIIATDNDDPGNKVADIIRDECSDFVSCVRVRYKPGKDTFDQTIEYLQSVNTRVTKKYEKVRKHAS